MSKPFVSLCPEVTRTDALNLVHWLEDEAVVRYLSDSRHVSRFIAQTVERVQLPILTHLFNQGGRFFIASDRDDVPVGFVRLIQTGGDCEMVLVIGDRANWGRKLGAGAISESMKLAFFELRADRLIAKIHAENTRSLRAFERSGFVLDTETATLKVFSVTYERYLRLLREGVVGGSGTIFITEIDKQRLAEALLLAHGVPDAEMAGLTHEIERATVVDAQQVGRDVVTMNTRARLCLDDDDVRDVQLVYPGDAQPEPGRLSVCSPVGTAILGCREGDAVDWRIGLRTRRIRIDRVLYQPEAAGDFHL